MSSHLPGNSFTIDHTSVAAKIFQGGGAMYGIVIPSREQAGMYIFIKVIRHFYCMFKSF